MEDERILDSRRRLIEFCKDEDHQRFILTTRDRTHSWRLYAGFLGIATKPICSGETENFVFSFEGILFKVYWKGDLSDRPVPPPGSALYEMPLAKAAPPYPCDLEDDPAFDSMIYAAQVSQSTAKTHVVYVDWRAVDMLEVFLRELTAMVADLKEQAREAAVKAKNEGQLFHLFDDDEEESVDVDDAISREELRETRLDRVTVQIVCSRCGNNTFTATKIAEAHESTEGLLAHDFFGWEISDMGIACAQCGGDPKLDIQPMPNGDAQGPGPG